MEANTATPVQAPAHPEQQLNEVALWAVKQLQRDTRLFLSTTFAAHAAVIVNLVAVLS